jgi:hypothetical protein
LADISMKKPRCAVIRKYPQSGSNNEFRNVIVNKIRNGCRIKKIIFVAEQLNNINHLWLYIRKEVFIKI